MDGENAPRAPKYPPQWTPEDIAIWEAGREDREYRWRGAALLIQHRIEQLKQEWERRVGTTFPGVDIDSLYGMAAMAGLKREELERLNAWDIVNAAITALEKCGDISAHIEAKQEDSDVLDEPDELYKVRIAAHDCAHALYEYIRLALKLTQFGEDPELEQFKGKPLPHCETGTDELIKDDFETPSMRLQAIARSLVAYINEVIEKHQAFLKEFEPLEDELAAVYPGLQELCGVTGRSHCKALESFVFHVVRYTFDGVEMFTPESEIDPSIGSEESHGFTASSWYPALKSVLARFPSINLEDHVHETIEQELDDAWNLRLSRTHTLRKPHPNEPPASKPADRSKLRPKQLAALEIVEKDGPILGKNLARRLKIKEATLYSHTIPAIKPFGVSKGPDGYYIAQTSRDTRANT